MKRLLPLAMLAALSSMGPAQAGLFTDDGARRAISDMRMELNGRLERLEASSRGQLELASQNELLKAEISRLHGQLEVLLHEVESLKQRQRDFYVDLDTRVRQIESSRTASATTTAPNAPPPDPAAESAQYEAALNLLKEGRYKDALTGFEQFIREHPQSTFLPGAHFWAGNAALQAKEVAAASTYFNTVLKTWPQDAAAPDAMLGLANSQQALGDAKTSQETLKKLVERFPDSSAAQAARQRLGVKR
ncbi:MULTISPECIES: tol-pal system protein YbgF [Aromatoleum]|uniref:Cell division coordinator CpoB n=2 Tax=Aromatoleum TaxID=551759 RepID=A0ABX1NU13_9RHOO|nr:MULTISPECIES: tol-pal system protein YbgF [Aromatoleum]MCK0507301.1 tol-pal system protein YbgF [Aromatoleum anaerobium]NMG15499.1 tol-pal system protein YbgF [Aromatoleum bremense]QTQ31538.1 Tol-Pal system, periplasmic component [Aromatoleum bremense]